jgi:hypothetical protein
LQENVHKLEVPIALHSQSIAAIQPKVEQFATELKEVERRFVAQVTELKTSSDTFITTVNSKLKESDDVFQRKFDTFTETQQHKQDELTSTVKQVVLITI